MNALDILKYGHQTSLKAVDELPDADWETPGACGVWSVKNIIAHLASYEHVLVEVLTGFLGGGPTPYLESFNEHFNDLQVAMRQDLSVAETLGEYNAVHARVIAVAAQLPAETFRQIGTLPWYGMEYALDDVIVYMYYGHKREHSAQIAVFRDRLGR
ncbi:MAG TPA: DinB family protein [Roseiflexaceae bacterium]